MKYKSIETEIVLFSPTSPSEACAQPLGETRHRGQGGVSSSPSVTPARSQPAALDRQGPAGRVFLSPRQRLPAAVPLPARRPPQAERLAGTHSCALPDAHPVTHGPGSPGTPDLVLGPQPPVFLFGNSAASAPTTPSSPAASSAGGGRRAGKAPTSALSLCNAPGP